MMFARRRPVQLDSALPRHTLTCETSPQRTSAWNFEPPQGLSDVPEVTFDCDDWIYARQRKGVLQLRLA